MKQYEVLPDGGVRLHLPSGMSVVSALKPSMLEKVGYTPYVPPRAEQPTAQLPPEALQAMQGTARGAGEEKRAVPDVTPIFKGDAYKTEGQRRNEELAALDNETNIAERNRKADEISAKYSGAKFVSPEQQQQKPGEGRIKVSVPDAAESAGGFVGGSPRRVVVVPGGFPRVSAQVQRGAEGLLPSAEDRKTANDLVDESIKAQATADLQSLDITNRATDAAEQLRVQAEKAIALRREKIVSDLNRRREILNRDMVEIENNKVDPKRFYRQRGGFAKALSFAAALAGGIRAGIQGGENKYLARMDRLAEQDIQEQIDMRNLRERGIKIRSTELDKLTDLMMGDQDAAAAQLRLQYGAMGDQLLREAMKQSGNRQVQAKLEGMLAQRYQQRQFEAAQLWQQFGTKTVENFARVAPQVVDLGGGGAPRSKRQIEIADKIRAGRIRVRGKDGLLSGEPESVAVRHARDAANKFEWFINDINEIYALAERAQTSGNPNMVSEVRRRITAAKKKIAPEENVLTGQGGMTTEEIARINMSLSSVDELLSRDTIGGEGLAAIDQTRQMWERSFDTFARNTLVEMPGNPEAGVAPWDDEQGYYNPRPFKLPALQAPAEPQVRD